MKNNTLLATCIAAAITPMLSHAQQFNATQQSVTFALIETYEAPALQAKGPDGKVLKGEEAGLVYENEFSVDNYKGDEIVKSVSTFEGGTKMGTFKISNREILQQLVDDNVIDAITGYSIVVVKTEDGEYEELTFCLSKKGEQLAPISSDYISVSYGVWVGNNAYKSVTTYDYVNETETTVETGKGNGKDLVFVEMNVFDSEIYFGGVLAWVDTLKTLTDGISKENYTLWIPSNGKINAISGGLYDDYGDEYEDEAASLIEGTVILGLGAPISF
jgi:hypothetical protein